jgi:hypothetical protein
MATTITKLYRAGVLQSSVEFDEITYTSVKISPTGVYASEFDEVTITGEPIAERRSRDGKLFVSGYFDEVEITAPPPPPPIINDELFTGVFGSGAPSTYNWTVPAGVTSVSVVAVGGGGGGVGYNGNWIGSGGGAGALAYANNITVVPGNTYTVTVGHGGYGRDGSDPGNRIVGEDGGNSSFSTLVVAGGGKGGSQTQGGAGGIVITGTGGAGGAGGSRVTVPPGGGGAGGYSGAGGAGSNTNGVAGSNGSGGGAGGGGASNGIYTVGQVGAGVGVYGQGSNGTGGTGGVGQPGAVLPTGGSGGLPYYGYNGAPYDGSPGSGNPVYGGTYGGGGSGSYATGGFGGDGAVRIVWSEGASFPYNAAGITLAPSSLTSATQNASYSATITASGSTAPYTYSILSGSLPSGLILNPTGTITGTPAIAGAFNITVRAVSNTGLSGTRSYTLTVAPIIPLSLTTLSLSNPILDVPYVETVSATGGVTSLELQLFSFNNSAYNFSIVSGSLPTGLTLNSNGTIEGVVTAGTVGVRLVPSEVDDIKVGEPYEVTLSAVGGQTPYTFALTSGSLPPGVTLNSNGTISGFIPRSDQLEILPSLISDPLAGTPYFETLTGSNGTAPYTFTLTSGLLPIGLTLNPDGTITGTTS